MAICPCVVLMFESRFCSSRVDLRGGRQLHPALIWCWRDGIVRKTHLFQETLLKDYQSHVTIHHYHRTHLTNKHRHSSACRRSCLGDIAISGMKVYIRLIQTPPPPPLRCVVSVSLCPSVLRQSYIVYFLFPWFIHTNSHHMSVS